VKSITNWYIYVCVSMDVFFKKLLRPVVLSVGFYLSFLLYSVFMEVLSDFS